MVGDTTGDKNDRPLIEVLVTEEDHTQMKCNSQVEFSIDNETPSSSKTSTGNPDIVLNIWNNDSCVTCCVPLCVKLDFWNTLVQYTKMCFIADPVIIDIGIDNIIS